MITDSTSLEITYNVQQHSKTVMHHPIQYQAHNERLNIVYMAFEFLTIQNQNRYSRAISMSALYEAAREPFQNPSLICEALEILGNLLPAIKLFESDSVSLHD